MRTMSPINNDDLLLTSHLIIVANPTRVEADPGYNSQLDTNGNSCSSNPTDAITLAARQVANSIAAKSLVCFTLRGSTVLRASKGRPSVPILAITPFKNTARQLALSWGVYAGE